MKCIKTGFTLGFAARNESYRGDLFKTKNGVFVANVNPNSLEYNMNNCDIVVFDDGARCEFGERNVFVFDMEDASFTTESAAWARL